MLAIYTDANEDNPIVGERIGMKVNHAAESGIDLLAIVQREVVNKSLTVVIARQHIGELLVRSTKIYKFFTPLLLFTSLQFCFMYIELL